MGGSRFFGPSLSLPSSQGVWSAKTKNTHIYICVAPFFLFFSCGARVAGYRAGVASTPVSTYGVEAPAARAHGAHFERYVLAWRLLSATSTDSFTAVPILGDALYGGATTPSPSTHFSTYDAGIPEGRLFLHSSSISFWVRCPCPSILPSSQRLIVCPEVPAKGSSQALSFDNFCPTSGGLCQNMSGHELEFT